MQQLEDYARRAAEKAADIESLMPEIEERVAKAKERADEFAANAPFFSPKIAGGLFQQRVGAPQRRNGSEDSLYEAGKRALDSHRWDEALEDFNQVASRAGARADAAWFWKAYALNKLGRSDEAVAAIAELRKSFPNSRWLDDAKALELEVQQAAGKPVSPDQQADEDLKLIAINSIMQSDPDRAIPLLQNLLKSSTSPKLKERAVYVLAQSGSPKAHEVLEQIARGAGNPDLQVKAIEYMRQWRRQNENNPNLLPEIYASTSDLAVKRAILNTYGSYRDYDHLLQAAKAEKNHDLLLQVYGQLGNNNGQPELWQLYQAETSADGKTQILEFMYQNGNVDKLGEVVRTEKDPKVRSTAIRVLAQQKANTADTLVSVYGSEQDEKIKQTIVDSLYSQRNAKAMVDLARAEKDPKMKLKIVDRLGNMKSKEASDYLLELLSK
ncbi:MAG: HEAT repeat domain-containing protein [Bryobacteraceae bacterium]